MTRIFQQRQPQRNRPRHLGLTMVFIGWLMLALAPATLAQIPPGGLPNPLAQPASSESEQPDESVPDVPQLRQLDEGWFDYLADASLDQLDERISKLRSAVASAVDGREDAQFALLAKEIARNLDMYRTARRAEPAEVDPLPELQETYSIQELLSLFEQRRKARLTSGFLANDINRQERSLGRSRSRSDTARVQFADAPSQSPERVRLGLQLLRDRVALATRNLEIERARQRLTQRRELLTQFDTLFSTARERLSAAASDLDHWQQVADEARADVDRLAASDLDAAPAEEGANTPILRTGLADLQAAGIQAQLMSSRIRLLTAQLAITFIEQSVPPAELETQPPDNTDILSEVREQKAQLNELRIARSDTVEEVAEQRSTALSQSILAGDETTSEEDGGDPELAEMLRNQISASEAAARTLEQVELELAQAELLAEIVLDRLSDQASDLRSLWIRLGTLSSQAWNFIERWSNKSLFTVNETPVTTAGIVRVIIIVLVAWWLSSMLQNMLGRLQNRRRTLSSASIYTLSRILHYIILVVAVVVALSSIGLDFTKFALFASALGIGLGFGLQNIINNFVSGLIILFEKSLKVGDFIELESGLSGEVRDINIRSTLVTTNDNIDILVPNAEFVSGRVTNWTLREALRRVRIPFGVAYGADKDLVRKAVLEAAAEVPFTLPDTPTRKSQVWLMEFGDSSLNFELVVWLTQEAVKVPMSVQAAYTWAIESALKKFDIEIPFPQRDIHLRSYFGYKGDAAVGAMHQGATPPKKPAEPKPEPKSSEPGDTPELNDAAEDALRHIEQDKRTAERERRQAEREARQNKDE